MRLPWLCVAPFVLAAIVAAWVLARTDTRRHDSTAGPATSPTPLASGSLRVDYPEYNQQAPLSVDWAGKETWPKQFPAELQVPLNTEVSVWVGRQDGSFQKKLTLTAAAPSASVFVPTFEPPPLGLFGFARSELPEATSFERVTERALPPAPLAFGLGAWQHGNGASLFGIDLSGNVVKVRESASGVEHVALGRVAPDVLAAKLGAARPGVGCSRWPQAATIAAPPRSASPALRVMKQNAWYWRSMASSLSGCGQRRASRSSVGSWR